MAFNPLNITQIAQVGGVTWFDYVTTDTNATVAGAGYFSTLANQLDVNDKIWVKASDFSVLYYVSAVTKPVNIQGVSTTTTAASVTVVAITATAGSGLAPSAITGGPLSVVGRSANTSGADADISAIAASNAVLRESGSTIGFGTINSLASLGTNVYDTGTWTPSITFATPGDLNVVYSQQAGTYTKIGRLVTVTFNITTTTWTWTTSAGNCFVNTLPFTASNTTIPSGFLGALDWGGITKAGYTQISAEAISSTTRLQLIANASATARAFVTAADMPSGTQQTLRGTVSYEV